MFFIYHVLTLIAPVSKNLDQRQVVSACQEEVPQLSSVLVEDVEGASSIFLNVAETLRLAFSKCLRKPSVCFRRRKSRSRRTWGLQYVFQLNAQTDIVNAVKLPCSSPARCTPRLTRKSGGQTLLSHLLIRQKNSAQKSLLHAITYRVDVRCGWYDNKEVCGRQNNVQQVQGD